LQSYFEELFPIEKVRACHANLERHSDLKLYTTPAAVADLEQARRSLGYETINIYGISYGSLLALQYLAQYPNNVRAAALAGVTTPAAKLPLLYARGAQDALDDLIRACDLEHVCRSTYPNLQGDVTKVLASFEGGPLTLSTTHPKTKELQSVRLTRTAFAERLRSLLYSAPTASLLPLVIHRAARKDWTAFLQLVTRATASPHHAPAMGAYFTVTCSEAVPLISEDEIARETRGTFLGDDRIRRHQAACRQWPQREMPPSYYAPVYSSVPVLMLSGELDGATPARLAAQASKSLANSRQILLPGTAHDYASACAKGLIAQFISTASPTGVNTRCVERLRRPPFTRELPTHYLR
jgi:pimeloyl-ACP methyl ester carboxylesterase